MARLVLATLITCALSGLSMAQDISEWGILFGGNFSSLHGTDAENMGIIFPRGTFPDEREPFGYAQDSSGSLSGELDFSAGAFMLIHWSDFFYTRVEAQFARKSAQYGRILSLEETYGGSDVVDSLRAALLSTGDSILQGKRRYEITNSYLEIPVFFGWQTTREFSVFAGMQFAYLLLSNFDAHIHESPHGDLEGKKSYSNVKVPMTKFDMGYLAGFNYNFTEQFQLGTRFSQNFMPILDHPQDPVSNWWTFQVVASFNFSEW